MRDENSTRLHYGSENVLWWQTEIVPESTTIFVIDRPNLVVSHEQGICGTRGARLSKEHMYVAEALKSFLFSKPKENQSVGRGLLVSN